MERSNLVIQRAIFLRCACIFPTTRQCLDTAAQNFPDDLNKALIEDVILFDNYITKEDYIAGLVNVVDDIIFGGSNR